MSRLSSRRLRITPRCASIRPERRSPPSAFGRTPVLSGRTLSKSCLTARRIRGLPGITRKRSWSAPFRSACPGGSRWRRQSGPGTTSRSFSRMPWRDCQQWAASSALSGTALSARRRWLCGPIPGGGRVAARQANWCELRRVQVLRKGAAGRAGGRPALRPYSRCGGTRGLRRRTGAVQQNAFRTERDDANTTPASRALEMVRRFARLLKGGLRNARSSADIQSSRIS